jgi:Ca-activated chloride channel family protein
MSVRSVRFVTLAFLLAVVSPAGPDLSAQTPAQAQGRVTITGTVVDSTLKAIAGAKVTLLQGTATVAAATTDVKGVFRFQNVKAGTYLVNVQHTGYPAMSRELVVPSSATTLMLPLVLTRPQDNVEEAKVADAQGRAQGQTTFRSGGNVMASPPPPPPAATPTVQAGAGGRGAGGSLMTGVTSGSPVAPQYGRDDYTRSMYLPSGETYSHIDPNRFKSTREHPLSTFGADVDTASYSNVRRFLTSGQNPPREAVRVEELINYFRFGYAAPRDGRPIALTTEIGDCPWAPSHKLVLIGARASAPVEREITGRNIVLLIDVSGSMAPPERLPLIKTALRMFVDTLRPRDTISIVTYAGSSGVALRPTPASHRDAIQSAIAQLNANGSTNGAQGLITAYRIARQAFIPGGINRVILATDGDFNVGITSERDLHDLIERERDSGVFLSVFGVGSGNLKDRTMEMLADKGNGHYAYLDSLQEARRVLIREADATLDTVAKDVKFQVEFNPAVVSAWKLIGYENRALAARDFNNDRKDAGEMGAGHTVTVLYEVVPVGAESRIVDDGRPEVDPLRYQEKRPAPSLPAAQVSAARFAGEWLNVKARYKLPESDRSDLITVPVRAAARSQHLPLASAVAEYGLLLRDAPWNDERWEALSRRVARLVAPGIPAQDLEGFKELVEIGRGLARIR